MITMKRTIALTYENAQFFGKAFHRPVWFDWRKYILLSGPWVSGFGETPEFEYHVGELNKPHKHPLDA